MTWVPPAFAGLSNSMVVTCKTQHWNKDEGAAPVPNVSPVQPQSMALDPNSKAAPTPTGGMMQQGMMQQGMMNGPPATASAGAAAPATPAAPVSSAPPSTSAAPATPGAPAGPSTPSMGGMGSPMGMGGGMGMGGEREHDGDSVYF